MGKADIFVQADRLKVRLCAIRILDRDGHPVKHILFRPKTRVHRCRPRIAADASFAAVTLLRR